MSPSLCPASTLPLGRQDTSEGAAVEEPDLDHRDAFPTRMSNSAICIAELRSDG